MKQVYTSSQLNDIIEWDKENWKHAIDFFDKNIEFDIINSCLEIGARKGGLSLWLALHGKKDIVCSDYVDNSFIASNLHKKYYNELFINYKVINAIAINETEKYDLICFKSVLGGIGYNDNKEAQIKAIKEMHNALKPGGILLFTENLTGCGLHKFLRRNFVKWGKRWRYLELEELKEMTSSFCEVKYMTYGFLGNLGRAEWQRTILGKIDALINVFIPERKKYIAFFICKK